MTLRRLGRICAAGMACIAIMLPVAGPGGETTVEKTVMKSGLAVTLDTANQIALAQNPDILRAVEGIRRTRGLVVEVRAQALPKVTLTGTYNQTDPRLLEGGGGSFGGLPQTQQPVERPEGAPIPGADPTAGGTTTGGDVTNDSGEVVNGGATPDSQGQIPSDGVAPGEGMLPPTAGENPGGSFSGFTVQDKSYQVSIEVQQVIYSGGQVRAAMKIAKFTQDSSYYTLRDTIEQTVADVKRVFYEALVNRSLITVQEESITLLEQELEDQIERHKAGTVPRFNVLRAEVELANAQPELIRAKNATLIAQLRLARILGIDYGNTPAGSSPVTAVGELTVQPRNLDLAEALVMAKARRAYLKVQRHQILIEAEQIKVALAGYKPKVNVNGGYQLANSRFSDDLSETVNGWFFGVTGSWAIFDGFATSGKVTQARAKLEQARITYEDSVRQVETEVAEAYSKVREAEELLVGRQKNIEQALESLRLADERFSVGAATQLDLLDARVALTRARVTELEARYDYNVAMAEFDRVTAADTRFSETFDDPLSKRGEPVRWDKLSGEGSLPVRRATKVHPQ